MDVGPLDLSDNPIAEQRRVDVGQLDLSDNLIAEQRRVDAGPLDLLLLQVSLAKQRVNLRLVIG